MLDRYLVILLVKLGVGAALASIIVRSNLVKRMLMRETRTMSQRLLLALSFGGLFAAGAATRVMTRGTYQAVDSGLEGSMLAGLLGGYVTGLVSGILISIPAMFDGEYLTMPLYAGLGVLGGLLRDCAPDMEEIWRFSPLFDLHIFRLFRAGRDHRRSAFQLAFLAAILFAELLRQSLGFLFPPKGVYYLSTWGEHPATVLAVYAGTLLAVTLPLKVWNNTRNEGRLEEQQRLLIQAKLQALTSQINPHFLFNTLNSVSSLIRTNPAQARLVIYKLSNILRRLLRKTDNFSSLREELDFIEDYLSIEVIRFGDKLRFEKDVEPASLDVLIPSMLLQPIIENCIKHGLSNKVEGGTIRFRAGSNGGRLRLVIEDDGAGIPEEQLANVLHRGIGVSNVSERLKVVYGNDYSLAIDSQPGQGTRVEIVVSELKPRLAAVS